MTATPFILLDDARVEGARNARTAPARLYTVPDEIVVARRLDEVDSALARIGAAPGHWAGMIAYEAGLALEPRLAARLPARTGAAGPLVWFARFAEMREMTGAEAEAWLDAAVAGKGRLGPLDPLVSPGGYAQGFDRLKSAICAGDIYQANYTFELGGTWEGDPLAIYRALRGDARSGYGAIIWDGAHWHLSVSPELFFTLEEGRAEVRPMKGTAPRGRTAEEDAAYKAALAGSVKDLAENLMIVDLMRNDLARVAEPGSVRVEAPFAVETYPTVHQMVTTVHARLQPGADARDLVRAIFPCGSITGAPKIRAMELIDEIERDARGLYCGAIGRIDAPLDDDGADQQAGEAAFNVAIRTVRLLPDFPGAGRGRATMGVGSAVVADSAALPEWRECLVKGDVLRLEASSADLIETMAFDPAMGIALLELHLERMKASAAELGFEFDRHALRNAIHVLCFDLDVPSRVRLLVSKAGAHALDAAPLPPALPDPAICAVLPLPVAEGDWRLRHKTTDRNFYEGALRAAKAAGAHEALLLRDDGRLTEGSFTNLFVPRGDVLVTPPAVLGLLPGILRRSLLESGRAIEGDVTMADLEASFFIGNALRGLMPARLLGA
ncbi:aminobenzoate synthetase [Novosphingobium fuchskuhlense]|uniref:Probable branched-chain-amino-acid aminotransferase n=1 Tax=Novosphingobium fuchskuhlense TaxID=1117702 RepID=A0A117UZJ4_9SPHN|nr:aminodeoxychorismate synthase component I [Novosphingobium fuchskuhlense]KUR73737.1 aminobenzoate synthetase [Novosphingobium fuchskuhlense]